MARPKAALVVTKVDRQVLDSMAHRARTAPQLARRARIVLACATGLDNTTVAKKLRMSKPTVGRWRQRFIDKGVDGLLDEPRPGAPRTINDTQVEAVVTRTLETTPRGATHWSTRTLAKATGVSPMRVHRLWQAFGLQPHRTKSFKLSPDPFASTRSATSWGCISIRRSTLRSSASTKSRRSRPWIARRRCSPCARAKLNGGPTTTHGTGRRRALPHWK